ncbi:MAG: glycoside hydrolase family 57 protein [Candidatus Sumerlaeota bacterium]|nr:glycoside hydrolase family 57 protein [Candidatus Sumerlaeota bacterium]
MSDSPLDVLILWHMHQPFYKSLRSGRMAMPWVRLHGVKDYLDMVLLAREFPGLHVNINWVPSLLDQIAEYAAGEAREDELDLSRADPEAMDEETRVRLLQTHFSAHGPTMIDPHPRYAELRRALGAPANEAAWRRAARRFAPQDLRDVQVWMNLTWVDPLLRESDPFLEGLVEKGAKFTEDEKRELLERQRAILGRIIPAAREAWDAGAIEVSVSPYYHPILPLLCDTDFARRARPRIALPTRRFAYPDDAEAQIVEALDRAEALFGRRPRGMWPSEGSVCDEIIPMLSRAGVEWIATDEEVLAQSLGLGGFGRDSSGVVEKADVLYRAYSRAYQDASAALVFRDHRVSDMIGFEFSRWEPAAAAKALIAKLEAVQKKLEKVPGRHAAAIILDGENCWEYYRQDGAPFLREFYGQLASHARLRSATISRHLADARPLAALPRLHSGSWINHDFDVWIGHPEDNTAWDLLVQAREAYAARLQAPPPLDPKATALARQSLFIAEGSDWNWWYGDDHDSGHDDKFDELYREHLTNAYRFLGLEPPSRLETPILRPRVTPGLATPRGLITPVFDGKATSYYEWFDAGVFDAARSRGAMHKTGGTRLSRLYFGFDLETLYIRIDLDGRRRWSLPPFLEAAILIFARQTYRINVELAGEKAVARLRREAPGRGWNDKGPVESLAADRVLEVGVAFERLGLKGGDEFGLQVELREGDGQTERQPPHAPITLTAPDPDFEAKLWIV